MDKLQAIIPFLFSLKKKLHKSIAIFFPLVLHLCRFVEKFPQKTKGMYALLCAISDNLKKKEEKLMKSSDGTDPGAYELTFVAEDPKNNSSSSMK